MTGRNANSKGEFMPKNYNGRGSMGSLVTRARFNYPKLRCHHSQTSIYYIVEILVEMRLLKEEKSYYLFDCDF